MKRNILLALLGLTFSLQTQTFAGKKKQPVPKPNNQQKNNESKEEGFNFSPTNWGSEDDRYVNDSNFDLIIEYCKRDTLEEKDKIYVEYSKKDTLKEKGKISCRVWFGALASYALVPEVSSPYVWVPDVLFKYNLLELAYISLLYAKSTMEEKNALEKVICSIKLVYNQISVMKNHEFILLQNAISVNHETFADDFKEMLYQIYDKTIRDEGFLADTATTGADEDENKIQIKNN